MSAQVQKALKQIEFLDSVMTLNLEKYWNTPLRQSLQQIESSIRNDRLIHNFLSKAGKPGLEALSSELAIRSLSKVDQYLKQIMAVSSYKGLSGVPVGMGWSFSDLWGGDESSDRELGLELLRVYFDAAKSFSGMSYSSFDAFLSNAESKVPQYADLIGELVKSNKYSTSVTEAKNRLADLARKSQGAALLQQIVSAAGGSGDTVNWTAIVPDLTKDVASEVMQTAGTVLQDTGAGVLGTLKLVKYLPWILGGAAVIYLLVHASKSGGGFGRAAERFAADSGEALKTLASRRRKK